MTSAFPQDHPDTASGEPSIGMLLDGYELRAVLREDDAAVVFHGHHVGLRRDAEVRVLRAVAIADDPAARKRFHEAAVMTARLEHPGIVPIYGFGADDTTAWVISRLLVGRTLADEIDEGPLSARQALRVAEQVADALDATHRAGLVHRDVRPGAVWPVGRHVLLGLPGVARSDGATRLLGDAMLGDPQTLAPEQLAGEPAGPASDIYALAALWLACVLGEPPFGGGDVATVLRRRAEAPDPPRLILRDGEDPPELNAWLASVLAVDPAGRVADATTAAHTLRAAVQRLPESAVQRPGSLRRAAPDRATADAAPVVRPLDDGPLAAGEPPGAARGMTRIDRQRPVAEGRASEDPRRRSRGWVALAVASAIALPILAFAGGRESTKPRERQVLHVGPLIVHADGDWAVADARAARGPLSSGLTGERLLHGPAGTIAEVGLVRDAGPPSAPLGVTFAHAAAQPVRIGRRPALRYTGATGGRGLVAYVLTSDRGTALVGCTSPAKGFSRAGREACDRLAGAVTLAGHTVPPAPDAAVARTVGTALLSLHNLVVTRQLTVAGARGGDGRAALGDVEELYKRALADLSTARVPAPHRPVVAALVRRLATVVAAYDALRVGRGVDDDAAVTRAVGALREAVAGLKDLGYEVTQ